MTSQATKNWCFWTVVLKKTLESPLDCKEIKPVNPKGNQPWILIERIVAEVEAPILWPPYVKNWLIWKDPDAGKDWRWEKGMRGWYGWTASPTQSPELDQTPGDSEGQRRLVCCSPCESISSLALNLLYGLALTSIHDYWQNHNFDYTDLFHQSDVFAF